MFKLTFRITWPLAFVILLAVLAYLVRASNSRSKSATPPRPINHQRPPVIITMPAADRQESREPASNADLDAEVLETVRKANIHSEFADLAEKFRQSGEKRRAAYTTE